MTAYKASLGDRELGKGDFQTVRAAVAEEITSLLAANPEGMAEVSGDITREFGSGKVQKTVDTKGVWIEMIDFPGGPVMLRVSKGG